MKITVLGDPNCDHNLYRDPRHTPNSSEDGGLYYTRTEGGSLLLQSLIEQTLRIFAQRRSAERGIPLPEVPAFTCEGSSPSVLECAALSGRSHAFALWEPQPANLLDSDPEKRRLLVWRAAEPSLGYGRRATPHAIAPLPDAANPPAGSAPGPTPPPGADADILVLDDAGLDFRELDLKIGKHKWIVLKLTGSVGEGRLWEALAAARPRDLACLPNLVIILSAAQLRSADVRLTSALSWEATLQDLRRELDQNSELAKLKLASHLIVSFPLDGALWIPNNPGLPAAEGKVPPRPNPLFVFDGERAEGEWRAATGPGIVFGYLDCFTAAIVQQLCMACDPAGAQTTAAHSPDSERSPDFESALIAGLTASRALHRHGHGPVGPALANNQAKLGTQTDSGPCFPFVAIADAILSSASNTERFACATLPANIPDQPDWMLLDEWHVHAKTEKHPRPYFDAAFAAAVLGPRSLERFPVARFGDLRSVDRKEIEGLRIIRQAMQDYRDGGRKKRPLNLGVFGPPGAGKSFGVGEIVKAVFGEKSSLLTFNLSQFSSATMLNDAFHQIRDKVVAGEIPVAFWDEFDSESYRWLQYFLAPMNDGVFQEGPITHPIGKCVFIFAGATSHTFDTFGPPDPADPDHPDHSQLKELSPQVQDRVEVAWREFVLKKGPDFKSRLVATLDVLGPNPRQKRTFNSTTGYYTYQTDLGDRCWPIRRAFFIRAQFGLKETARLEMDPGLLQALLEIPRYLSGSRSLEFLCGYLRTRADTSTPRRSHLPGDPQLARHVPAAAFREICEADNAFHEAAEALAPGLHESWRCHAAPGNPAAEPWESLASTYRRSTIKQALRIPRNLSLLGCIVKRGGFSAGERFAVNGLIEQNIERLAEAEHNGWMVERLLDGWRYGRVRDNAEKLHHLLLPYNQLPQAEKLKDIETVRSYVERLASANYRVELPQEL